MAATRAGEMTEGVVEIYSDGACRGNPGPGGWGALLDKFQVAAEAD